MTYLGIFPSEDSNLGAFSMGIANLKMLRVSALTVLKYVIAFSPFGMRSRRSASLALILHRKVSVGSSSKSEP